jgi:hypothetical protein
MSETIKPCPFCGSDAIECEIGDESVYYRCRSCEGKAGRVYYTEAENDSGDHSASYAAALEAWNTRSTQAARDLDSAVEAILTAGHMNTEDLARLRAAYENNSPARRLDDIKQSALSIFNDPPSETPQIVRDVIEWYDATLRQP